MNPRVPGNRARRRGQQGAAMVETAIVMPLVVLLAFSALDAALAFNHANDVGDATRTAVRVASATSGVPTDDYGILQSIRNDRSLYEAATITKVVIYRAVDPQGKPLSACETASVMHECNVYHAQDLYASASAIAATETAWAPSSRVADASGQMPYVGVRIESVNHQLTSLFPFVDHVASETVMRVEPGAPTPGSIAISVQPNPNAQPPNFSFSTSSASSASSSSSGGSPTGKNG